MPAPPRWAKLVQTRLVPACFIATVVAWFLWLCTGSLQARFASDDPFNMGTYWQMGIWKVLWANLLFWSSAYRPMGGLFYLPLFHAAHLNPLPYHLAIDAVVLANTALVYAFVRLLEAPKTVAALASLVTISHGIILTVFFFPSESYDVFCVFFFCASFVYYLKIRRAKTIPNIRQTVIVLALYIGALNSKEMAVTFPAFILIYELLYHRPVRSWTAPALSTLITIAFIAGKMLGPLSNQEAYRPVFTATRLLSNYGHFQDDLFYRTTPFFNPWLMLMLWTVLLIWVIFKKEKYLRFFWCFTLLAPLPIAFIPQRGGFCLYLPLIAWAVLLAAAATSFPTRTTRQQAVFLTAILLILWLRHSAQLASGIIHAVPDYQAKTWNAIQQFRTLNLAIPHGSNILFLNDPFGNWDLYFIAELWYNDPTLHFFLQRQSHFSNLQSMDYIFDWKDNKLVLTKRPPAEPSRPLTESELSSAGIIDDASPRITWTGAWANGTYPQAFQRTITYSPEQGAKAVTTFTGSTLTYVYTKASNRGMAQVMIDNKNPEIVDLFSRDTVWQSKTVFTGLTPGSHTLELTVLHRKHPEATDFNVDVDAFIVR